MKKITIIFSLLVLIFASTSCKKSAFQNPLASVDNLSLGSYLTLSENVNLNFAFNVPTSEVSIKVDKYGSEVQKIVLFVVEGANSDPTSWKRLREISYTGPGTVISATSLEVATALGVPLSDLSAGKFFTFYNQIVTTDGRVFDISNAGNALATNSNYNACFQWQAYVTCPFTGVMTGNYTVQQDDWGDWLPGEIVNVTDGPGANQIDLSEVWPNTAYGALVDHLIVNVNPADGTASVPFVTFGNQYPGTATAQGAYDNDVAGYVFSCTGFISLNMEVTYNGSSQGNLKLVLQKN